jgi:hypothetical protein
MTTQPRAVRQVGYGHPVLLWVWLAIGLLGWFALATAVGLFIAQMLRRSVADVIASPGRAAPAPPMSESTPEIPHRTVVKLVNCL